MFILYWSLVFRSSNSGPEKRCLKSVWHQVVIKFNTLRESRIEATLNRTLKMIQKGNLIFFSRKVLLTIWTSRKTWHFCDLNQDALRKTKEMNFCWQISMTCIFYIHLNIRMHSNRVENCDSQSLRLRCTDWVLRHRMSNERNRQNEEWPLLANICWPICNGASVTEERGD